MIIDRPGIFNLTREQYDADVCPTPSLTNSVAKILLSRSPAHARMAHPKLNPHLEPDDLTKFDIGRVFHALMLDDKGTRVEIIDADDWRKKAAREARAAAIAAGKLPVLKEGTTIAKRMVRAARRQLELHEASDAFRDGLPEQTLIWQEPNQVWCRARLDWLPTRKRTADGPMVIYDLKSTSASAHPDAWVKTLYGMDGDLQAAFYRRAVRRVLGVEDVRFRFVVVETEPPFALSVIELEPAAMDMAERKVEEAIRAWRYALNSGQWHGYPARVAHVSAPAYEEAKWLAREERDRLHGSPEQHAAMIEWQSPMETVNG